MKASICRSLVTVVVISLFLSQKTRCTNSAEQYEQFAPFNLIEYLTNDTPYSENYMQVYERNSRVNPADPLIGDVLENVCSENTAGDDFFPAANYNITTLESNPLNNASAICPAYNLGQSAFPPAEESQYDRKGNFVEEAPQYFLLDSLANADPVQGMVQTPASENIGGVFYDQSMSQCMYNQSQPAYHEISHSNSFYGTSMDINLYGMQGSIQNDRSGEMENEYGPNSHQDIIRDRMLSESSSAISLLPRGPFALEYTLPVTSNGDEELAFSSSSFVQPPFAPTPYTSPFPYTQSSFTPSQYTLPPLTQQPPPIFLLPSTSRAITHPTATHICTPLGF